MKKILLSFLMLCMATYMWALADNVISYAATSKLEETMDQNTGGLYISGFGSAIKSHTFVNGVGTITFQNPITNIKYHSFYNCNELTGIALPSMVATMGDDVFEGCRNITWVSWNPSNCVCEEQPFFWSRNKITSFSFGSEVEVIPDGLCESMSITSIDIPASVRIIGESAFEGCFSLTSVYMRNGVETIGVRAFNTCTSLTSVTLSNTITTIESQAFSVCSNLTTITLPTSLTKIGHEAFWACSKLTSITIPDGVKRLYYDTFHGCRSLSSVNLGQVEQIDDHVFQNCTTLVSITIPESMKKMEANVFEGCTALTTVNWNANYCSDIVQSFYALKDNITSFTFGPNVELITPWLCDGMSQLSTVTIPASVRNIGARAFAGCTGLQEIHCEAVLPPYPSNQTFENVDVTIPVYIPSGTRSAYESTPGWSQFTNFIDPADESNPEGVDQLEASKQAGNKTILNGQVLIQRDGKTYTVLGNEMK